jgi:hypothetical protein
MRFMALVDVMGFLFALAGLGDLLQRLDQDGF